jgi:hypothetical protein
MLVFDSELSAARLSGVTCPDRARVVHLASPQALEEQWRSSVPAWVVRSGGTQAGTGATGSGPSGYIPIRVGWLVWTKRALGPDSLLPLERGRSPLFGHEPGGRPAWTSTRDPASVSAGSQARDPDAGD